jgi:hypothetical protein
MQVNNRKVLDMNGIKTLSDLFYNIKKNHERPDLLNFRVDNSWKSISTGDFASSVVDLSKGLSGLGVKKGEKIGIVSNPSPFWVMADLAIVLAGCITVPIFRRISPENLGFEINDSEMNFIFVGDMNEYEPVKLYGIRIKKIITIGFKKNESLAISFDEVVKLGIENPGIEISEYTIIFVLVFIFFHLVPDHKTRCILQIKKPSKVSDGKIRRLFLILMSYFSFRKFNTGSMESDNVLNFSFIGRIFILKSG